MSTPIIQPSFVSGEISPSLLGRSDIARYHSSASTFRNCFPRYQGGAYSRAGTAFVSYSGQTGRAYPPRLIPFQFSVNQGLCLEFGNFYMRVIYDGAMVTDAPLSVTAATQANPCVITAVSVGGATATANVSAVTSSYAPGERVTLAGGVYSYPAVVAVGTTKLAGLSLGSPGQSGSYAPADTIQLSGGTQTTQAVVTVSTTQVVSASIANAGTGGTAGTATVTGTTGTGTKFQANVTIASGAITQVNYVSLGGAYTANPSNLAAEPVTGGGLTGATLSLQMGVLAFSLTNAGVFTANPVSGVLTQKTTSGAGFGATFQIALFVPQSVTVVTSGAYSTFPTSPVSQASTTGTGAGCTFTLTQAMANAWNAGDWVYLSGIGGMSQLNGRTCRVIPLGGGNYSLGDIFGNPIDSTSFSAFTSAGVAARIYTLQTPWAEQDLEYLKFTQSADVMSICCVNQATGTEYIPYELTRFADNNWVLSNLYVGTSVSPPGSVWCYTKSASIANQSGISVADYQYVITAVDPKTGVESVASSIGLIQMFDISAYAGTATVNWSSVQNINQYNIYKCMPGYGWATLGYVSATTPPVGSLYGFAGSAYGTQFNDSNVTPDFSQVPPIHQEPFSRGVITGTQAITGGSGYTVAAAYINSTTGYNAVIAPVVISGSVVAYVVENPGKNYSAGDTISVYGDGSGATAQLNVGAQSGTYPGVVSYFQSRRIYANSLNNPDTYWMSQPGDYTNFDSRIPTIATDAITGSPWSMQVNGVQFMVSMPGGLVVLTGLSAWQLTGSGGSSLNPQPITPSNQQAQPQAYNGCSSTVPPVKIDYDILYVQSKGSIYRDLAYQFFTNIYTGTDLTQNSSHLFLGYTIREHAWCEEPYKVLWSVRSDGVLLSLTYLKPQEVAGWARHDTNGLFQSVCAVTEPPVDALYLAVQRTINGNTCYMIERMDDRIWNAGVEAAWCVDAGLSVAQPTPNATLYLSSPTGLGAVTGVSSLTGGANYSVGTIASVVDANGLGSGSGLVVALTIVGGVITAVNLTNQGSGYSAPTISFFDPTGAGSGASATLIVNNAATATASAPVFSPASVGEIIRAAGAIAQVTAFNSTTQVAVNILSPATVVNPNQAGTVFPVQSGAWTITQPFTTVAELYHLAGATVTGLADGNVIPPTVVSANGTLTLPTAASAVTVGLGFTAQLQSVYLDAGQPTVQGQRKKVSAATIRIDSSRGLQAGSNQPDGSTLSPAQLAPLWQNLDAVPDQGVTPPNALCQPLYTGDVRVILQGGYNRPGQVALQQTNPLPMNVMSIVPEVLSGDTPEQQAKPRQQNNPKDRR